MSFLLAALLVSTCSLACGGGDDGTTPTSTESDSGTADTTADTFRPATCADLTCPRYRCTCTNGLSMDGSGCTDGVCRTGSEQCNRMCGSGKVKSVVELSSTDAGPARDGGPSCLSAPDDVCGKCMADKCCAEVQKCGDDKDCVAATICLLTCKDGYEACTKSCNTAGNAAFEVYAQCAIANGCSKVCPGI